MSSAIGAHIASAWTCGITARTRGPYWRMANEYVSVPSSVYRVIRGGTGMTMATKTDD